MIVPVAIGVGSLMTLLLAKGPKQKPSFSASRIAHPSSGGFVVVVDLALRRDVPEGPLAKGTRVGLAVASRDGSIFRGEGMVVSGLEASYLAVAWIREIERVTGASAPPAPGETMITASDGIARILAQPQSRRAIQEEQQAAVRAAEAASHEAKPKQTKTKMPPREPEDVANFVTIGLGPILRELKYETKEVKMFAGNGDGFAKVVILRVPHALGDKAPNGVDFVLFESSGTNVGGKTRAKLALCRAGQSVFEVFDADDVHAAMTNTPAPKIVDSVKIDGPIVHESTTVIGAVEDCGEGDVRAFGFSYDGKEVLAFADTAIAEGPRLSIAEFASWLLKPLPVEVASGIAVKNGVNGIVAETSIVPPEPVEPASAPSALS